MLDTGWISFHFPWFFSLTNVPLIATCVPIGGIDFGGGGFGVRRPLRFLTYKLGLSESQVADLAHILDELKTERAQAAVDDRRTLAALADALSGESFDEARDVEGADLRRKGAERLSEAVVKALSRIHKLLSPEQRERWPI